MFVQVIKGKVTDRELCQRQFEAWRRDVKPHAIGFLGSTTGVTDDGTMLSIARFESAAAAKANSDQPAQTAWFTETAKAFDGTPTFRDSTDVDVMFGGGSDTAGFVQVMEGKVKNEAEMRTEQTAMESDLKRVRPDLLGALFVWHGGGKFTQIAYFTSQAEARRNEQAMADEPAFKRFMDMMDGPMTFYDLPSPDFD
jgi:hypothetical protein